MHVGIGGEGGCEEAAIDQAALKATQLCTSAALPSTALLLLRAGEGSMSRWCYGQRGAGGPPATVLSMQVSCWVASLLSFHAFLLPCIPKPRSPH